MKSKLIMRTKLISVSKYGTLFFIALSLSLQNTKGQGALDALTFSTTLHGGSARSHAMGGAFSALGSDITSSTLNPAGLGLYQSHDMQVTFVFDAVNTETDYLNNKNTEQSYNFTIQGFGFAFSYPDAKNYESGQGRQNTVFAISMNRLNLLDFDLTANATLSQVTQQWNHYSRGRVDHVDLSLGVNESNKLYYGISFSLTSLDHIEDFWLEENDPNNVVPSITRQQQQDYFNRKGLGFGIKTGILYQATPTLRVAAAFHTPTIFSIDEQWDAKTRTWYDNNRDSTRVGYFDNSFSLLTPLRFNAGISNVFGNRAILSLDYELSPYQTIRLDGNSNSYSEENQNIKNNYTLRHTVRLGGEVKLGALALRAGGFYYSSPIKSEKTEYSHLGITGGTGFRIGNFYTDLAYSYMSYSASYMIYGDNEMLMKYKKFTSNIYTTFGLRF